jgi:hypothetical protein
MHTFDRSMQHPRGSVTVVGEGVVIVAVGVVPGIVVVEPHTCAVGLPLIELQNSWLAREQHVGSVDMAVPAS